LEADFARPTPISLSTVWNAFNYSNYVDLTSPTAFCFIAKVIAQQKATTQITSSKMVDAPDELNLKRAINNINREICEDFITF
jgi:hypothetical protein